MFRRIFAQSTYIQQLLFSVLHIPMSASGIIVTAHDTNRQRYGVRFVPTGSAHETEKFVGMSLAVRSCRECGTAVIRDSSMDAYDVKVPDAITLPSEHPMAREFKDMLDRLPGHEHMTWGMFPHELGACTVHGMMQLDSLASFSELRMACPACACEE